MADSEDEEEVKAPAKKAKQASLSQLSSFQDGLISELKSIEVPETLQLTGMRASRCAGEGQGSSAKAENYSEDNQRSIRSSKGQLCSSTHGSGAHRYQWWLITGRSKPEEEAQCRSCCP